MEPIGNNERGERNADASLNALCWYCCLQMIKAENTLLRYGRYGKALAHHLKPESRVERKESF